MRLKYQDIEVEGRTKQEIEWLIARVQSLAKQFKINKGGGSGPAHSERKEKFKGKFIKFPKGKFLIQELANDLNISVPCINQRLMKMREAGDAQIVGRARQEGQRGCGTPYWKVINFPTESEEFTPYKKKLDIEIDLDDPVEDA